MDNMDTEKNRSGKNSGGALLIGAVFLASIVLNNLKESCTVKLSAQLSLVYIILLLFFIEASSALSEKSVKKADFDFLIFVIQRSERTEHCS